MELNEALDERADAEEAADPSAALQQLLVEAARLSGSEARVLAALLRLGTVSIRQLSEATGISHRPNIYPVLESLSGKGLCERRPGRHAVWECLDPKEVLARLQSAEKARMQAAIEASERGFEQAAAILAGSPSGTEVPPITFVEQAALGVMYLNTMSAVEGEILVFNRGPYPGDMDRPDAMVLEALARGVRARALWGSDELNAPDGQIRRCADAYAAAGVEQRVVEELSLGMAVLGEEIVMLNLPSINASAAVPAHTAVAQHPAMVQLGRAAFEYVWQRATPYDPSPMDDGPENGGAETPTPISYLEEHR